MHKHHRPVLMEYCLTMKGKFTIWKPNVSCLSYNLVIIWLLLSRMRSRSRLEAIEVVCGFRNCEFFGVYFRNELFFCYENLFMSKYDSKLYKTLQSKSNHSYSKTQFKCYTHQEEGTHTHRSIY